MKNYILFSLLFCLSLSVSSQTNNSLNDFDNRLIKINNISDKHELNYKLSIFKKELHNNLNTNNLPVEFTGKYLCLISTSNNNYKILYFSILLNDKLKSFYYFIIDTKNKQIYSYNIPKNILSSFDVNSKLQTNIIEIPNGEDTLCEVDFADCNDKSIFKIPDLELSCLFEQLYKAKKQNKIEYINKSIKTHIKNLLLNQYDFNNKYKSFYQLSTIISSDKKLKICTWQVPELKNNNTYSGFIAIKNSNIDLIELTDKAKYAKGIQKALLTSDMWFGAMYYDITTCKYKNQTYYVLLGFKQGELSNKKVIETLKITKNNCTFGLSVLKHKYYTLKRRVFEYSAKVSMALKFRDKKKIIIFDHLSPMQPIYRNKFEFYGPDFSYDRYRYEKGIWMLEEDV